MGLDSVELVMDIEDCFGMSLQPDELEGIVTVGDIVALVRERLAAAHQSSCLTLPAFIRVRRIVRELTGDDSRRIRPRDWVTDSLTERERRQFWNELHSNLNLYPPSLVRPNLLRRFLNVCLVTVLVVPPILWILFGTLSFVVTMLAGLAITIASYWATRPLRIYPPPGWETFGEVATKLVGVVAATKQLSLSSTEEIFSVLRPVIAQSLAIPPERIELKSRFVHDLGMS